MGEDGSLTSWSHPN